MAELTADCPRCGAQSITFDALSSNYLTTRGSWMAIYEVFSVCRRCGGATNFVVCPRDPGVATQIKTHGLLPSDSGPALNNFVDIETYVSLKDAASADPPEHVPENIAAAFKEAATCVAVGCNNAAGTMFRLCIDLATRELLPDGDESNGPNAKQRRDLGLRLPWLFDNETLPADLRGLSECVKQDGNDGAHQGTLTKEEARDLMDFTTMLLERLYTTPRRVELAADRRARRRQPNGE